LLEKRGDTSKARKCYDKGIFLNKFDYLSRLYFANFLVMRGDLKRSVIEYKKALKLYAFTESYNYQKNSFYSGLKTVRNSYVPNDLLYYISPRLPVNYIYNNLVTYYSEINDIDLRDYYLEQLKINNDQVFKGKIDVK
jgi:tetratricopeptide (TPR) repeat protein